MYNYFIVSISKKPWVWFFGCSKCSTPWSVRFSNTST